MSDFLKKLYDEEMSKMGSAEFSSIMRALPRTELEDYLGLKTASEEQPSDDEKRKMKPDAKAKPEAKGQDVEPETNLHTKQASVQRVLSVMEKLAVGGPATPPMPDSEKGQLKIKQDVIHRDVQAGSPKKETVPVDHQGPGKEAVEVERDGKKVTTTKEAMAWADDLGRKLAAAMEKEEDFTTPEQQAKAKALSGALKATKGQPTEVRKAAVHEVAGKLKTAYGPEPEPAEQQGSTVDATEKAKVAMMAYRSTHEAPEHIKQAAIHLAGRKISGV